MSFVSYAQNFEDVMLWRALKHVDYGFYIDVGANHPIDHSVTKAFYEKGWRGVNIEPVRQWFDLLESDRIEDLNLNVALAECEGTTSIYEVINTGLSTFSSDIAENHKKNGFDVIEYSVPIKTLNHVFELFPDREINFLKIDVEGAESRVLNGLDLSINRPWIIVVEATLPLSSDVACLDWEKMILDHKYDFTYFDGLNRFYVAAEHAELKGSFSVPPNVFDDFVILELNPLAGLLRAELDRTRGDVLMLKQQINGIYSSRSWKITSPLRWINKLIKYK